MSFPMEYHIVLMTDDGSKTYDSTALIAVNNLDALEKAKSWIASVGAIAEDAWLQINLNGMGIKSLRPGEF